MRENMGLYRGKRKDTGEWVEGNLFENDNAHFPMVLIGHIIMSRDKHFQQDLNFDGYDLCEVDPETVGQFTGMTDIGGRRIFEGDIMKTAVTGLAPKTGAVLYQDGAFGLRCTDGSALFLCFVAESCTVIGNIHDTPVLTKEVTP